MRYDCILSLLVIPLLICSCTPGEQHTELTRYADGSWAEVQYVGKLYHGTWIVYRKDGTVKWLRHMRFGKQHGVERIWYDNRKLKEECHFASGKFHNSWRRWYESGQLKFHIQFNHGLRHGLEERYTEKGVLSTRGLSKDGRNWEGTFSVEIMGDDGSLKPAVFAYKHGRKIKVWNPPLNWEDIAGYNYTGVK